MPWDAESKYPYGPASFAWPQATLDAAAAEVVERRMWRLSWGEFSWARAVFTERARRQGRHGVSAENDLIAAAQAAGDVLSIPGANAPLRSTLTWSSGA